MYIRDCLYTHHVNSHTDNQIRATVFPGTYTAVTRCQHGSPQMKPTPRTNTDDHECFELSKSSVLASRFPTDLPGRSRTNKDHYGPTRQLHGSSAGSSQM